MQKVMVGIRPRIAIPSPTILKLMEAGPLKEIPSDKNKLEINLELGIVQKLNRLDPLKD